MDNVTIRVVAEILDSSGGLRTAYGLEHREVPEEDLLEAEVHMAEAVEGYRKAMQKFGEKRFKSRSLNR